jgi:hypothetical protein
MEMQSSGLYLRQVTPSSSDEDIDNDAPGNSFFCVRYVGSEENPDYTLPTVLFGAGESETEYVGKGMIIKLPQGLWVGDSASLIYNSSQRKSDIEAPL